MQHLFHKAHRPCILLGKELQYCVAQHIVHAPIELVAPQPRAGVMHDLTDQQQLGKFRLQLPAEPRPEPWGYLIGHIQPPAVDPRFPHPMLGDLHHIISHFRVVHIQLRHMRFRFGEGLIVRGRRLHHRKGMNHKPVFVPGILSVLKHILEGKKSIAGMVEYSIQQHSNPVAVGFIHQCPQILCAAKRRIDL
ncbi:hypothetical protein D3C75_791610 [compost metagenome]